VTGYGQFCPIARASEIFAERWTPIIVRNLLIGCSTFSAIEKGAPGIPKSLLTNRLRKLERYEVITRQPNASGRGWHYEMTEAGVELAEVIFALGKWGMRWLEIAPDHLDPGMVLWALGKSVNTDQLPHRRLVVRFTFTSKPRLTLWALWDNGELEACVTHPGGDEDLVITAEPEWFVQWHFRRCTWRDALAGSHITIEGRRDLARAFPTWFHPDFFSDVEPGRQHA
jgi:DNA-binding HxlR family transcriptional regulator